MTYVLVHGAWHSGRIWDPVVNELTARGFRAIAPDLPSDSVDACAADYCEALVEACAGLSDLVVVGHTSGCLMLPLLPARLTVTRLIYVNPLLPLIGSSFSDQMSAPDYTTLDDSGRRYDRDARSYWEDREAFKARIAADCSDADLDAIWAQMRRQSRCLLREETPLKSWPDTPSDAFVYVDDLDLPVPWMERCARERLGIEPTELPGSQLGYVADPVRFVDELTR